MLKGFVGLIFLTFISLSLHAQSNWVLQKEKDGIKISNRHSATSSFNDIRVEVDMPGNIEQLAKILLDVVRYTEWSYAVKKSVLIKEIGPGKIIYFNEIEVPWPATNRYLYANFELKTDPVTHSFQLIAGNLPDYKPEPKDLIKVPFTKALWTATTLSKNSIHVEYTLELNPGGSLPAWVLNLFSNKGPMETFTNLRKKMMDLNPSK